MTLSSRIVVLVACFLSTAACNPGSGTPRSTAHEGTPTDPVDVCTKDGQTCVFSAGKLGLCMTKATTPACTGPGCLRCTSLH